MTELLSEEELDAWQRLADALPAHVIAELPNGLLNSLFAAARSQRAAPVPAGVAEFGDGFNGDTPHLIACIEALLVLDAKGALVPHGVGGHGRALLTAAASRLALLSAPSVNEIGAVVWHSSEEGAGPDVGLSLDLGGGWSLWAGEMPDSTLSEHDVGDLADGWWLVLYGPKETIVAGRLVDQYIGQNFIDQLAALLASAPSVGDSSARDLEWSHTLLGDLCQLQGEYDALNGGGPGWRERWNKALDAANEQTRIEP